MKILHKLFFVLLLTISGFQAFAQNGCTDPLANNYDPLAVVNDGTCTYSSATVSPSSSTQLSSALNENSGLILWDNDIWTHQDGGNSTEIFSIPITDLSSFTALNIPGIINIDWEDIAQDEHYVYIGDFGNNANGNRTDLKIYRVTKSSILLGTPVVDEINFSYSDQTDFTPQGGNNTDFDCEAMIATDTNIYLFTKQWVSQETRVYSLPKTPGAYSAVNEASLNVNGLITGATYLDGKQLVVLSGYSTGLQPFVYLLYDFSANNFFNGNKRKVNLNLPFHQIEGIASQDGINYFASNERIVNFFTIEPQIHKLDLTPFLLNYLGYETSGNASNFDDPLAWVPGIVPPSNSDLKISHDLNLNQDYNANNIEVRENITLATNSNFTLSSQDLTLQAGSHLTFKSGSVLSVGGNVINEGTLYFKSDGLNGSSQLDTFIGSISGTGKVTVERFIPAKRAYRILSTPVSTTDFIFENWQENGSTPGSPDGLGTHITGGLASEGFDQSPTNNPSMFTFDNTNANGTAVQTDDWIALPYTNSTKLLAGEAYLTFVRGDRSIDLTSNTSTPTQTTLRATGDLFTGPISPTLSTTHEHYSLVANPYQAIVNYNEVTRDDLTDYIYVWDASITGVNGLGAYVTVDVTGNTTPPNPFSSDASQFIAPGMSFFVQNLSNGSAEITVPFDPSLTFNEDDKSTVENEVSIFNTDNHFYINSRLYKTLDLQTGNTESDAIGLRFSNDFTTLADDEDATKLYNPGENYAVVNNSLRSIDKQDMPVLGHEIDLHISNFTETNYNLTFEIQNKPVGFGVFLIDNYLNTQTEMADWFVYDFFTNPTIPGSIATDRFSLIFDNTTLGVETINFGSDFSLYPNPILNGQFRIKTPNLIGEVNVEVSNLLGQQLSVQKLTVEDQQVNANIKSLSAGVYIVKLTQDSQSFSSKLIVE